MIDNRKHIRLVKQKHDTDCALCCFAMLTGIRHRRVMSLVGDCWDPDHGMMDTVESLERLGLKMGRAPLRSGGHRITYVDFKLLRKHYTISAEYFRDQVWGRRALISVPSLNLKDGCHMVYWHYDRLYDPSTKKTYKDLQELRPVGIVLFLEKKL